MKSRPGARPPYKLFALLLVLLLVGLIAIAVTAFLGGFTSKVNVTLRSDRAGLVMEPDADVKMRGVKVGQVKSIDHEMGAAKLDLEMYPDELEKIPKNILADIRSTTVFGAKYVNLEMPDEPTSERLAAGDTIDTGNVTVEFNTLFQRLSDVLNTVQPEKINATLGAVSTALNGQGKDLGETFVGIDDYLGEINPSLPDLERTLETAAPVTDTYAQAAPDLMTLLGNATSVGETVVDEQDQLEQTLTGASGMAGAGTDLINASGDDTVEALDLLQPTVSLTNDYSEVLTCFIVGADNAKSAGEAAFGGSQPGLKLSSYFLPGQPSYRYPENLPKVNAKNEPSCYGLPWLEEGENAPYVVTDSGANVQVTGEQTDNQQDLWAFLLGPPPPGWDW